MIVILGGGISGLSLAYALKKAGKEFLLLEEDKQVGGKIKSIQQDGYSFELGPNTVLINNKEIKNLLDDLGLSKDIIQPDEEAVKKRFVLYEGKMEALPSGPGAIFTSKLLSLRSIFKVISELFNNNIVAEEESLAGFIRRRLGNQIYENFVYPFVTGIYAGNPEKMTMDYTLKILKEAELKHGGIIKGMVKIMKQKKLDNESTNLPKQKIFTFKEGLQTLPISIAEYCGSSILCNAGVSKIEKSESGYSMTYKSGNQSKNIVASTVVSTLPVPALKKLVWDQQLINTIEGIKYVPAFISHYAYNSKDINTPQKAFGLLGREKEDAEFLGILFNSKLFPHSAPKGKELITVISGGYKQEHFLKLNQEEIEKRVQNNLERLFQIKRQPELKHFYTWKEGIPQYEIGHKNIVAEIERFEKENQGFYIEGNFKDGISVSDCIANGINLAIEIVD